MNSTAISLGWDCEPAKYGVEIGVRKTKEQGYHTCPFDLMYTNYQGVIECIQDDFKYFCDLRYLHVMTVEKDYTYVDIKKGDKLIINTKYNFIFNHESPGHGNLYKQENWENGPEHFIIDNFKALIERYTIRIQNFRNYIHDPQNYIYFILSKNLIHTGIQEMEKIIEKTRGNNQWQMVKLEEDRLPRYNEGLHLMLTIIPSLFFQKK